MIPRYQHDCSSCIYLGYVTVPNTDNTKTLVGYDLYTCPQAGIATVIARYGSDGENYVSGFVMAKLYPALKIAIERALNLGLLYQDGNYEYKWRGRDDGSN